MLDPYQILDIDPNKATDESVRQVYLKAVRNHPPDRSPKAFERIRRAFDLIQDEQKRIELELFGFSNHQNWLDQMPEEDERLRVGMAKWIAMMEEEAKRIEKTNPYERRSHD